MLQNQACFRDKQMPLSVVAPPVLGVGEYQSGLGSRHSNVEKTTSLLNFVVSVLLDCPPAWKDLVLDSHDVYPRELQTLSLIHI